MGLDQYAFSTKADVDIQGDAPVARSEMAYWRKHPSLQGFMAKEWNDDGGGSPDEFNCVALEITAEILDRLETAVKSGGLPATAGFFFGGDSSEYYRETDLEFILSARKELSEGRKVWYSSWW